MSELELELQKKIAEVKSLKKRVLIEKFKQDFKKTTGIFIDVLTPQRDYQVEVKQEKFDEILQFILEKDFQCHSDQFQDTTELELTSQKKISL